MAAKLVIVESPAKARTLARILGRSYLVKASLGHVRDLPRGSLGVDIEHDFTPKYVIPAEKRKVVGELKKAVDRASCIYLATDPDREGEAISWHIVQVTGLDDSRIPVHRVVFHEIIDAAVKEAFRHPRSIDMDLVHAQQARRILDRLVGYKLSPLLWKKVRRGLSAGRVQSVAVRLIVEREREIKNFIPQEYWIIEVHLAPRDAEEKAFPARVFAFLDGAALSLGSKEEADRVVAHLARASYGVRSVQTRQVARQPAPPFTTSTLQQEAWRKLRFTAARTMAIAQQLYEGLPLGEEGPVGLITYMRTDSTYVAPSAINETREFIREKYGAAFLPPRARQFATRSRWAQEAHEAIRPTSVRRQPEQVRPYLNSDQLRLYELIWKRMVASQMAAATYDATTVEIEAIIPENALPQEEPTCRGYRLRASSSAVRFPGFILLYTEGRDEEEEGEVSDTLPPLKEGERLLHLATFPHQYFTQPPPRYTEATLIRELEQNGIGRPSTYAPILATIQEREYVTKVEGRFQPTRLGIIVTDLLTAHFPQIVDVGFTAQMEEQLDEIARGKCHWLAAMRKFYPPFQEMVHRALANIEKIDVSEESEERCPNCGRPMVVRVSRFGKFLACSGYPQCRSTMPYMVRTGIPCPRCGGELVEKVNRRKKVFYGCSNYPRCEFVTNYRPLSQPCPACGKLLVQYRKGWARCVECNRRVEISEAEEKCAAS
jgi:DNA topoisomerase-1